MCHRNGGRQTFTTTASKPRILLVDDEQDIASVLKRGLELGGFAVDAFNESQTAIDNFKPHLYDQIILDIRMPGMNGFDLARQIWQKDPNARVCFLSSFEIYEDEAKKVFKDLSSTCFLKKPIAPTALAAHIQTHLTIK